MAFRDSLGESDHLLAILGNDKIVLNVGGCRYETLVDTLANKPNTRLGELAGFHSQIGADEYFFDRNPEVFNTVLDYYRSGELHVPMDVCGVVVKRELEYWRIEETMINPCCSMHYYTTNDNMDELCVYNGQQWQEQWENKTMSLSSSFKGVARIRIAVWRVMCRPFSSTHAKVYWIMSMLFVMAAITGCFLEMFPALQDVEYARNHSYSCIHTNATNSTDGHLFLQPILALRILDYICSTFFSVEFLIQLIVTPERRTFLKSPVTVINLVALVPFYLMLLFDIVRIHTCLPESFAVFVQIVFVLRIVRIFRVFQMLAYSSQLKILLLTLRDSICYLLVLSVVMGVCTIVFATLAFYAEMTDADSHFKTLPIGLWWAIITITKVGYGDIYPRTIAGYCVGAACAISGTVIVALAIPILFNNFTHHYTRSWARDKAHKAELRELKRQELQNSHRSVVDDGSVLISRPKMPSTESDQRLED